MYWNNLITSLRECVDRSSFFLEKNNQFIRNIFHYLPIVVIFIFITTEYDRIQCTWFTKIQKTFHLKFRIWIIGKKIRLSLTGIRMSGAEPFDCFPRWSSWKWSNCRTSCAILSFVKCPWSSPKIFFKSFFCNAFRIVSNWFNVSIDSKNFTFGWPSLWRIKVIVDERKKINRCYKKTLLFDNLQWSNFSNNSLEKKKRWYFESNHRTNKHRPNEPTNLWSTRKKK